MARKILWIALTMIFFAPIVGAAAVWDLNGSYGSKQSGYTWLVKLEAKDCAQTCLTVELTEGMLRDTEEQHTWAFTLDGVCRPLPEDEPGTCHTAKYEVGTLYLTHFFEGAKWGWKEYHLDRRGNLLIEVHECMSSLDGSCSFAEQQKFRRL